jgi:hypothetical protein
MAVQWVVDLKERKEQAAHLQELESKNRLLAEKLLKIEAANRWQDIDKNVAECIETQNSLYPNNPRKQVSIIRFDRNWLRIVANPAGSCTIFTEVIFDPVERTITFTSHGLGKKAHGSLLLDLDRDNTVQIYLHAEPVTAEEATQAISRELLSAI